MNPMPSLRVAFLALRGMAAASLLALGAHAPQALALDAGRAVTGSGTVVTEARAVPRFTGLQLDTGARVEIRQGEVASVEVRADDNIGPLIKAEVKDGSLAIEDRQAFRSRQALVVVVVERLEALSVGGSTAVSAGRLSLPELSLSVGGSSTVLLESLSVPRLKVSLGGSGALRLAGTASNLSLSQGGSSMLDARGLEVSTASVSAGGSSAAVIRVRDRLSASAGGSATLRYLGKPKTSVSVGGSASVLSVTGEGSAK